MNNVIFAGERSGEIVNKNYEIVISFGGTVLNTQNGKLNIFAGQFAVIPPAYAYSCTDGEKLHVILERALISVKDITVLNDAENGVYCGGNQAKALFNSSYKNRQATLGALGNLIVSYINLYIGEREKYSPVVEIVKADIEKNLSDPNYSLEDCIRKLPLNYDYVRKLFKKETGATPHDYLVMQRMALAEQLISSGVTNRYSDYTVAQLAEACGYSEPLYFSRVFKKYYKVAPAEYIKSK